MFYYQSISNNMSDNEGAIKENLLYFLDGKNTLLWVCPFLVVILYVIKGLMVSWGVF